MGIWLTEEVENVPDHVKELCEEIFQKNGFDNCEVTTEPACPRGENFFSIVYRLIAKKGDKSFSVITKMALVHEYFRILSFTPILFQNENAAYSELFPKFDELQNQAGIDDEDKFHYAKFYGSAQKPTEVIILEDLKQKGYENLKKNIDYENVEIFLTLKELAKFHALSFVTKNRDKIFFEQFTQKLINCWDVDFNYSAVMSYYNTVQKGTSVYFDKENQKTYLKESLINLPDMAKKMFTAHINSKYSSIGIGFTWRYKPMYTFENGKPKKIVMLDYQHINIGSPAIDVHSYILNSAKYATRKLYYKQWLDYYYKELDEYLAKFDLKAEEVYPRKEFDKDSQEDMKYVFAISILIASFWAREAEIRIQSNKDGEVTENPAKQYKETVVDLMNTLTDLGYID